jgi:formate dehydrogenase iron-sulfur subunit
VLLDDLCDTMVKGSLCAMGGLTPMPVQSAIKHFPEDFESPGSRQSEQQSGAPV